MIGAAVAAIVCGIALVRLGWSGRRGAAAVGWAVATVALAALAIRDGAWGIAIAGVAGIATALVLVLWAGWTAPAKAWRPAREAPSVRLPYDWRGLGRRVSVFVLTVPVASAAALWLAFGAQASGRRAGMAAADATVVLLFLFPMLWCVLMCWQMTRNGPTRMLTPPALAAAAGTLLWAAS